MKIFAKLFLVTTMLVLLIPSMCLAGAVSKDGYYNGIKLCADIKVKVVDSFPDLKVKRVNSFPDHIGEWQFVESFPDFTIQYVESFPDIKIKFVNAFPGVG